MARPANLILLHLESLSRLHHALLRPSLPHLERLFGRSLVFDRFFSSATSTLMVLADVLHGNSGELDNATALDLVAKPALERNLLWQLAGRGYDVHFVCFNTRHSASGTQLNIWPPELPPVRGTGDPVELSELVDAALARPPFALYLWNLCPHLDHSRREGARNFLEEHELAWTQVDDAVGTLVARLERRNLLDDTVIAAFGDHGDEFWIHGYHDGLAHGGEPRASLTWAPLALSSPGVGPGRTRKLASTVDLKATCMGRLGLEAEGARRFGGLDLLREDNAVVFSQNLLANQRRGSRSTRPAKAYAAVEQDYLLLASVDGLELYAYPLDPTNHFNLLTFFELEGGGRLRFRPPAKSHSHFAQVFLETDKNVRDIEHRFAALWGALQKRIEEKNTAIEGPERHPFDLGALRRVNRAGQAVFFAEHRRGFRPAAALRRWLGGGAP